MQNGPESTDAIDAFIEDFEKMSITDLFVKLKNAAHVGDLSAVRCLLNFVIVRENADLLGNHALCLAASNGHLQIVKCLLALPSVLNYLPISCIKVVCDAAKHGRYAVVKYLLEEHTVFRDYTFADDRRHAILLLAASKGHFALVKYLLTIQVMQDELDLHGGLILYASASYGNIYVVRHLLKFQAVKDAVAYDSNSVLNRACEHGNYELVSLLLEFKAVQKDVATLENRALESAVKNGQLRIVNLLLQFEAVRAEAMRAEAADKFHMLLHYTAKYNLLDVAQRLVHLGGEEYLEYLLEYFPILYCSIIHQRYAIACAALSLKAERKENEVKVPILPYYLRYKILEEAFHDIACGVNHPMVKYRISKTKKLCPEVGKLVLSAINTKAEFAPREERQLEKFKKRGKSYY